MQPPAPRSSRWVRRRSPLITSRSLRRVSYSRCDPINRPHSYFPTVLRPRATRVHLNHIAFDTPDADGAIRHLESRGVPVDLPKDCFIYGPEELWYQIDRRDTPFPIGHPANDPAVSHISAKFKGVSVELRPNEPPTQ